MINRNIRSARQRGFSLIELMLALVLGLVVITGIVQLFVGNSRTYNVLNGQARMQESARFALDIISRAARNAGYFGCAGSRDAIAWSLTGGDLANSDRVPEFDVARPVQGFNDIADPAVDLASLPTNAANSYDLANGIEIAEIEPATDLLVVRSMETPGWRLRDRMFPTGANNKPAIAADTDIAEGDIVMVSNCEQSAVFRVTHKLATAGGTVNLEHEVVGGTDFSNAVSTVSAINRTYQPDALVGRIESTFFFIAPGAGQDNAGNAPLALWQKVGTNGPVELVQGVQDLQVLYGVDTVLDDEVRTNRYLRAGQFDPEDADVVSLRVMVTVNSVDAVTDDGQPLRRTFGKTIRLRNANPEAV